MPIGFPEGTTALTTDSEQRSLQKIVELLNNGAGGGGGESGDGSPEGVVTAEPGTTYWDATNDVFYVKDTGSGSVGWREIIA